MAKRIKKSEIVTLVAQTNHIARTDAQVVVNLVLSAMSVAREHGQSAFTKGWIRETVHASLPSIRVKNFSGFAVLLG